MDCCVKWSSQLEKLADELLICWKEAVGRAADPFGKVCIVVNDSATENWLKQYFLLDRKIPQVMMNLEFVRLPEFINDWLSAELYGIAPWQRQASFHPYSVNVLTWRIYRILSHADPDGDLKELLEYIGEGKRKYLKQFTLSEKLAVLYDDYLNSRSQMLRNWEKGILKGNEEVPLWQIRLYRELVSEESRTYAADYETVFRPGTDPGIAFEYGFPRYLAVHVFDVPFMQETTLHLLEKISEAFPGKMTFWHFNPSNNWLGDTDSKREMIRKIRENFRKQRDMLHGGENPSADNYTAALEESYASPEERLLGALASGARAMICNLCEDSDGRVDAIGDPGIDRLKDQKIFLHRCYSPRRELETIKDGLLQFFAENPEMHPHDAVVLCADWENYAPVIESVFSSSPESEGYIPVTVAGKTAGDTPFFQSLRNLLSFRENRFEADAVFSLLDVPAIREKYELDEDAADILRDMIGKANIRWGYDDADVRRILAVEKQKDAVPSPFTWQRGLDRMTSEFLYGFNEDESAMLEVDKIGEIRPCGFIEGDREKILASLWHLVDDLKWLRGLFAPDREASPAEIRQDLLEVILRFYKEDDETIRKDILKTRQTIRNTAESMVQAKINPVSAEVFITAVLSALSVSLPGMRQTGDSVLFAPLNCSSAVPHHLVWICGLNDGAFPKVSYRASYDLIGKHPSFFDATSREKDAFALLKAVLGSRKQLCFSHVGKDNHTNDDIPPSVLLTDLTDYFSAAGIPCTEYRHPMNAYSWKYFTEDNRTTLPPTYSAGNYAVAEKLQKNNPENGPVPFPLSEDSVTDIRLSDLAEFFSGPNQYLFHARGIEVPESKYDQLSSKECMNVKLDYGLQAKLMLTGEEPQNAAAVQVETGNAPDISSAQTGIEQILKKYRKELAGKYQVFQKAPRKDASLDLHVNGHQVRVAMQYSVLCGEDRKIMIFYENYPGSDSTKNRIRIQYLGANVSEGAVAAVVFGSEKMLTFPELSKDRAEEILSRILVQSSKPLPAEFPDYRKTSPQDDALPPDWQDLLNQLLPTD